jgi:hypothetical protein
MKIGPLNIKQSFTLVRVVTAKMEEVVMKILWVLEMVDGLVHSNTLKKLKEQL